MRKILYLEENRDTAKAVEIMLTNAGYEVDTVKDGIECTKHSREKDYDLILIDLMPPEMYGYDLYAQLSENCECCYAFHSNIPLSPAIVKLFKKVGISDHIVKPFNRIDLINRIDNIFRF